jgi:hypothetical protein
MKILTLVALSPCVPLGGHRGVSEPGGFSDWERRPVAAAGVALAWHDTSERWRYVLATSIVFAIVIQVAGLLAYYHFWNGVNRDDARVQVDDADAARQMWDLSDPQWWWTIRAAIATADFRAGLARRTASVVHLKVA